MKLLMAFVLILVALADFIMCMKTSSVLFLIGSVFLLLGAAGYAYEHTEEEY